MTLMDQKSSKNGDSAANDGGTQSPGCVHVLRRLRAVILLAGVVRSTKFNESIQRSLLGLPLDVNTSVIGHWYNHVCQLTKVCQSNSLPLRILVDPQSPLPVTPQLIDTTALLIERDPLEFRGTGGVLLDSTLSYAEDDYVVVGNAAGVLLSDLSSIVSRLVDCCADITILANSDGSPTGLMLIRCGTLRQISPIGFVDLNEQALPAIAERFHVRVLRHAIERYPVRNLSEYIQAIRQYQVSRRSGRTSDDPFAEHWLSTFSVAESSQDVAPTASLLDSVVLENGRVNDHAVLVRSIVCPGAIVPSHSTVIDEIVTS